MYHSRVTGFTANPWLRIRSSRLIAPDRPRGVKGVETGTISTEIVSSMITESIGMIGVECLPIPQGVDPTHLDSRMIDASTVAGEDF